MSDATLAYLGDDFIDVIARTFPSVATMLGIHDYDGELGSYAENPMTEYASELRLLKRRASEISSADLSPRGVIDHAFLEQQIASAILDAEDVQWWRRSPEFVIDLALTGLFFLLVRDFAPPAERARSLEARLRRIPSYLMESRKTLSDTPRVIADIAAVSAESGAAFFEQMIPEWAAGIGKESGEILELSEEAGNAMHAHAAWLRDEYAPACDAPIGIGEDLLAKIVNTQHMLSDTPDAIAARGEAMLEKLGADIDEAAGDLGFADWRSAVADVKKDVPHESEVVEAYSRAMQWTERIVREHDLVTVLDDARLEVRPTPEFWRHTTPYAAYSMPAPFEKAQEGIFWVTPPDGDAEKLKGHARASIPVVALHEGYPGHHLQLTRANRHPSRVRRLADSSLFIEGWAFYCEELAHEQGLLSKESRLCQLKDELWRACRVVIDMRLHQRAMTPEEAVEMLVREADLERPNAEAEVRRYTYTPGYQMSYAIGKQEILRLRERAGNMPLKEFHDRVVGEGSLPVPLIARALS